jgi:hypothetical protein
MTTYNNTLSELLAAREPAFCNRIDSYTVTQLKPLTDKYKIRAFFVEKEQLWKAVSPNLTTYALDERTSIVLNILGWAGIVKVRMTLLDWLKSNPLTTYGLRLDNVFQLKQVQEFCLHNHLFWDEGISLEPDTYLILEHDLLVSRPLNIFNCLIAEVF